MNFAPSAGWPKPPGHVFVNSDRVTVRDNPCQFTCSPSCSIGIGVDVEVGITGIVIEVDADVGIIPIVNGVNLVGGVDILSDEFNKAIPPMLIIKKAQIEQAAKPNTPNMIPNAIFRMSFIFTNLAFQVVMFFSSLCY